MRQLVVGVLLTVAGWIGSDAARACDRPGAPEQLVATPLSPTSVNLVWRNTTSKSGGSDDVWFDIAVADGSGRPLVPSLNITGGAEHRGIRYGQISSFVFNGLAPGREYRFQMRSRNASGRGGCVSEQAATAGAWTPTPQVDAKCAPYAARAVQQVTLMKSHGPMTVACNVISGPRWNPDRSAHYAACAEVTRTRQPDFTAGEQAARDDTIKKCVPSPGQCTKFFVQWRAGNDLIPLDWCSDIMGLDRYCESQGSHVVVDYPKSGGRAMICSPNVKEDSQLKQAEHIIRGVEEGTADAFVAAAPFLGPASKSLACVNGVVYACAVLALDLAELTKEGKQVAGVAGDAVVLYKQAGSCAALDVGACAKIGIRAALQAALTIPGKNPAQVAAVKKKCASAKDNAACIELGQEVVDAAGLNTK